VSSFLRLYYLLAHVTCQNQSVTNLHWISADAPQTQ